MRVRAQRSMLNVVDAVCRGPGVLSIRKCPACGLGDGGQQQRHFLSGSGNGSGRAGRGGKPEPLNLSHLGSPTLLLEPLNLHPPPAAKLCARRIPHPATALRRGRPTPLVPFRSESSHVLSVRGSEALSASGSQGRIRQSRPPGQRTSLRRHVQGNDNAKASNTPAALSP